jgi:ankyrin repeat protein
MSSIKSRLILLIVIIGIGAIGILMMYLDAYQVHITEPSPVTAAVNGDITQLNELAKKGFGLNYQDIRRFMWTPLIAAVYSGNTNVVYYLLSQNVNLEISDGSGMTALLWAVLKAGKDTTIVQMLLDKGANTNAIDHNGSSFMDFVMASPLKEGLLRLIEEHNTTGSHVRGNGK